MTPREEGERGDKKEGGERKDERRGVWSVWHGRVMGKLVQLPQSP